MLGVARAFFGLTQKDLVVETARKLEFTRTGKRITEILNETIQNLLDDGELQESFGKLHVSEDS